MNALLGFVLIAVLGLCALLWWRLGAALQRADYVQSKLEEARRALANSCARLDTLRAQTQSLADILFDPLLIFNVRTTPYTLLTLTPPPRKSSKSIPKRRKGAPSCK